MVTILVYTFNSDRTPLCESYLNAKSENEVFKSGGLFSKPSSCFNPLFFDSIATEIQKFQPRIVAIATENDLVTGTYFHSDFLPSQMKNYGYQLTARDKYIDDDQTNALRMSIYTLIGDNMIKSVQLSKGLIFNDNKFQCDRIYLGVPKAMVLYLQTTFGSFAFIGVQVSRNYGDRTICENGMKQKFINGKNIDQIFMMGDFANEYTITNEKLINYDYIDSMRQQDIPAGYEEDLPAVTSNNNNGPPTDPFPLKNQQQFVVPTYSPAYSNQYVKNMDDVNTYLELTKSEPKGTTLIGYHDRIFHQTLRGYPIKCLEYRAVVGSPMLSNQNPNVPRNRNHLGVLGVYLVNVDNH